MRMAPTFRLPALLPLICTDSHDCRRFGLIVIGPFCIVGRMKEALKHIRLLSSNGCQLMLPIEHWRDALLLALDHGWQPQGCEEPANWQPLLTSYGL